MIRKLRIAVRKARRNLGRIWYQITDHPGRRYMRKRHDDPLAKYRGPLTDNVR